MNYNIQLESQVNFSAHMNCFYVDYTMTVEDTYQISRHAGYIYYDIDLMEWRDPYVYSLSETLDKKVKKLKKKIKNELLEQIKQQNILKQIHAMMERGRVLPLIYMRKTNAHIYIQFQEDPHMYRVDEKMMWEKSVGTHIEKNESQEYEYDSISGYLSTHSDIRNKINNDPRTRLKNLLNV